MKLDNIWNNKLQAQGECTSTRDGESKEGLSGQMRTTTYLDSEQELVMPVIGHQLLHNYANQNQNWGWTYNIHLQASRSFIRNLNLIHKQPTSVALLACAHGRPTTVPLVNLSALHDS